MLPNSLGLYSKIRRRIWMIQYIFRTELSYVIYIREVENPHPFYQVVLLQVRFSRGTFKGGFSRDTETRCINSKAVSVCSWYYRQSNKTFILFPILFWLLSLHLRCLSSVSELSKFKYLSFLDIISDHWRCFYSLRCQCSHKNIFVYNNQLSFL